MKKVKILHFNWFQKTSSIANKGTDEEYSKAEVGENGVIEIIENEPCNGMQLWNYEIILRRGESCRVFNPNYVEYFKNTKS